MECCGNVFDVRKARDFYICPVCSRVYEKQEIREHNGIIARHKMVLISGDIVEEQN